MDWRRAKTILILTFLLLDSFLAYQLWTSRGDELEFAQQVEGSSSSLQDMINARAIKLAIEMPADMPDMYYLNVKYEDFSSAEANKLPNQRVHVAGNGLSSQFIRSIPSPESVPKGEFTKIMNDHILFFDEYQRDPMLSAAERLVYLQSWNTYPFFGGILQLDMKKDKIRGYQQTHFQVINRGSGKKVISSVTALRTLIENEVIQSGETIHSIQLGYYSHTYDAEIQVIAPVWRVIHGSKQVHYVNGITGVIEKTPSLSKKE
jgi:regulatory protein YycI of two-component signal transduction system YycFG